MKPHRLAVTDSLVFNYKLHEHMKVQIDQTLHIVLIINLLIDLTVLF